MFFTKYDEQGRITEVGQLTTSLSSSSLLKFINEPDFPQIGKYTLSEITKTYYDKPKQQGIVQENLRGKVAATFVKPSLNAKDIIQTHYSYDQHGNVKQLWQQLPKLNRKTIQYEYDRYAEAFDFG